MDNIRQLKWRIYYDDGSTFDNTQGSPVRAPGWGVICIVNPDPIVGRVIRQSFDFYYWVPDEGQWWGSDLTGLLDRLINRLPIEAVCAGRMISFENYQAIISRADKDQDFPPKSGRLRGERP